MNADPRNTRAFVVGIEQYGFGPTWDLPGPVADAHRCVAWLISRGVPPGNITVFLTGPVKQLPADVPPLPAGVTYRAATERVFVDALTRELTAAAPEVFWLWWGGHGVVQTEGRRALFFTDATEAHSITFQTGVLRDFLASTAASQPSAFRRVVAVVDACATHAHLVGLNRMLPHAALGAGDPIAGREFSLLVAAQDGQAAKNLQAAQTGLMSRELLPLLATTPTDIWPPDMALVGQTLRRRFLELNKAKVAVDQLPAFYAYETPAGVSPPLRFTKAGRKLTLPEKVRLRDALLACPSIANAVRREAFIAELPQDVRIYIDRASSDAFDVLGLLNTCLERVGGMASLIEALRLLDGSAAVGDFEREAARFSPGGGAGA